MTTTMQLEAGDLHAAEDRTLWGLLVPYGETGRTNLGRVRVRPGALALPPDPDVVGLNLDHQRNQPVGRAFDLHASDNCPAPCRATGVGVHAGFRVAATPEGDDLLAEQAANDPAARKRLSVEATRMVVRAGEIVSGVVYGAAAVAAGAFPSASLMAADAGDLDDQPPTITLNGVTYRLTVVEPDGDDTGDGDPAPSTTPDAPDQPGANPEGDTPVTNPTTAPATAPADLAAMLPGAASTATPAAPEGLSVRQVSVLMARAMETRSPDLLARLASAEVSGDQDLFAALSDIRYGSGVGTQVNRIPQWLGELWSGRAYQRRIVPLLGAVQTLTSLKIAGWKWGVKPEGGDWAGDKTAVPSNTPTTVPADTTASRFAGAHDHAREYVDFPSPEYWESYWRAMTESYARWSDRKAFDALVANATTITRGTVPADVSPAMVSIVDGAVAIVDRALPTFAIVAKDLWRDILLTRNDDTLTYLNAALGLEDGTVQNFSIQPGPADMAAGSVIVGAREAATPYELGGGTPVRVEALDMVKGGVDTGLFGYYGQVTHDAAAIALVTPAAP